MKKLALIILCICITFTLSGCAAIYDTLNFNRKTLANPESPVPSGDAPYQRQENYKSKEAFSEMVASLPSDGENCEKIMIGYREYGDSYTFYESYLQFFTDDSADDLPYAAVVGEYTDTYFYEDGFASLRQGIKYITDENFYEAYDFPEYRLIDGGGYIRGVLGFIEDNFASVDKDFYNGKEVIVANSKEIANREIYSAIRLDALVGILCTDNYFSFNMSAQADFDAKAKLSASISLDEDGIIDRIKISVVVDGEYFVIYAEYDEARENGNNDIYSVQSAYKYVAHQIVSDITGDSSIHYKCTSEIVSSTESDKFIAGNFTYVNYVRNQNDWYTAIRMMQTESDTVYHTFGELFYGKGDNPSRIEYNDSNFDKYYAILDGQVQLMYDMRNMLWGFTADLSVIEKKTDRFVLTLTDSYNWWDGEKNNINERTMVVEMDLSLSKILKLDYESLFNDEVEEKWVTTFEYDFVYNPPSSLVDYRYK